jgi:hypothetical protein
VRQNSLTEAAENELDVEPGSSQATLDTMTKESLQQQADRAEALAAQTADDQLWDALLRAARQYREQLKT